MKHVLIPAALSAGLFALSPIAGAFAETAYMGGLGGVTPGYSTMTGPNGEKVNTTFTFLGGDDRISYDNISVQSAQAKLDAWIKAHPGENTIWTYSESAQAAVNWINDNPTRTDQKFIILAPPKAGSLGYEQITGPNAVNATQVIVKGDSVADENGKSFETHLNGYKNLNMQTQTPVSATTLNNTNTKRNYYERPVVVKSTWAEKVAASKAARAERAEARKVAREERREASKQRWASFVSKVFKKPSADASAPANDAPAADNDTDTSE